MNMDEARDRFFNYCVNIDHVILNYFKEFAKVNYYLEFDKPIDIFGNLDLEDVLESLELLSEVDEKYKNGTKNYSVQSILNEKMKKEKFKYVESALDAIVDAFDLNKKELKLSLNKFRKIRNSLAHDPSFDMATATYKSFEDNIGYAGNNKSLQGFGFEKFEAFYHFYSDGKSITFDKSEFLSCMELNKTHNQLGKQDPYSRKLHLTS